MRLRSASYPLPHRRTHAYPVESDSYARKYSEDEAHENKNVAW